MATNNNGSFWEEWIEFCAFGIFEEIFNKKWMAKKDMFPLI